MIEQADNYAELLQDIKKHTLSFSKYYTKLGNSEISQFIYKDREIQSMMLEDIYKNHSRLEQLLREIMEYDINAETFSRYQQVNNNGAGSEEEGHHNHQQQENEEDE